MHWNTRYHWANLLIVVITRRSSSLDNNRVKWGNPSCCNFQVLSISVPMVFPEQPTSATLLLATLTSHDDVRNQHLSGFQEPAINASFSHPIAITIYLGRATNSHHGYAIFKTSPRGIRSSHAARGRWFRSPPHDQKHRCLSCLPPSIRGHHIDSYAISDPCGDLFCQSRLGTGTSCAGHAMHAVDSELGDRVWSFNGLDFEGPCSSRYCWAGDISLARVYYGCHSGGWRRGWHSWRYWVR